MKIGRGRLRVPSRLEGLWVLKAKPHRGLQKQSATSRSTRRGTDGTNRRGLLQHDMNIRKSSIRGSTQDRPSLQYREVVVGEVR